MSRQSDHRSYKPTQRRIQKNLDAIKDRLNAVIAEMGDLGNMAVDDIIDKIQEESLKICPIDTGDLIESATRESEQNGNMYVAGFGYKSHHAVFAHENANRGWDYGLPTTPGSHWKFLETPVAQVEKDIVQTVANKIKEALT